MLYCLDSAQKPIQLLKGQRNDNDLRSYFIYAKFLLLLLLYIQRYRNNTAYDISSQKYLDPMVKSQSQLSCTVPASTRRHNNVVLTS